MESPAIRMDTVEKLERFGYLLFMPLTPQQFRAVVAKEADWTYAGLMYDNLLRSYLRHGRNAIVAEGMAMRATKEWWIDNIDDNTRKRIKKMYYEGNRKFLINLMWNHPYGTNHPFAILQNGLPLWDLPTILGKVIAPEAVTIVIDKIKVLGGTGKCYEVRFVKENPQGTQWGISVKEYTPPS